MYGIRLHEGDEKYAHTALTAMEGLSITRVTGRFWAEYFPILKYIPAWFPGGCAQKVAAFYKPYVQATRTEPFAEVANAMVSVHELSYVLNDPLIPVQSLGSVPPCAAQQLIQEVQERFVDDPKLFDYQYGIARDAVGVAFVGKRLKATIIAVMADWPDDAVNSRNRHGQY